MLQCVFPMNKSQKYIPPNSQNQEIEHQYNNILWSTILIQISLNFFFTDSFMDFCFPALRWSPGFHLMFSFYVPSVACNWLLLLSLSLLFMIVSRVIIIPFVLAICGHRALSNPVKSFPIDRGGSNHMLSVSNNYLQERLKIWPMCQVLNAMPQLQYYEKNSYWK